MVDNLGIDVVASTNGQKGELNAERTRSARVGSAPPSFFPSPNRIAKRPRIP